MDEPPDDVQQTIYVRLCQRTTAGVGQESVMLCRIGAGRRAPWLDQTRSGPPAATESSYFGPRSYAAREMSRMSWASLLCLRLRGGLPKCLPYWL